MRRGDASARLLVGWEKQHPQPEEWKGLSPPRLEKKCRAAWGELVPRAQLPLLCAMDVPCEQTAKSRLAGGKSRAAR